MSGSPQQDSSSGKKERLNLFGRLGFSLLGVDLLWGWRLIFSFTSLIVCETGEGCKGYGYDDGAQGEILVGLRRTICGSQLLSE